jgi:hypothetical protein
MAGEEVESVQQDLTVVERGSTAPPPGWAIAGEG